MNTLPESVNTLPESMNTLPESMNTLPESMNTLPESMNTLPESMNTLLESVNTLLESVNTLPEVAANSGIGDLLVGKSPHLPELVSHSPGRVPSASRHRRLPQYGSELVNPRVVELPKVSGGRSAAVLPAGPAAACPERSRRVSLPRSRANYPHASAASNPGPAVASSSACAHATPLQLARQHRIDGRLVPLREASQHLPLIPRNPRLVHCYRYRVW
jgi:hypothetical protein